MRADDLDQEPALDVLTALDACRDTLLEQEGIAMYVALADARPGRSQTPVLGGTAGSRLGELFDHYHHALSEAGFPQPAHEPSDSPDLTGGARDLIDVLVVIGAQHLHARPEPRTVR